jgi:hypothetical protein
MKARGESAVRGRHRPAAELDGLAPPVLRLLVLGLRFERWPHRADIGCRQASKNGGPARFIADFGKLQPDASLEHTLERFAFHVDEANRGSSFRDMRPIAIAIAFLLLSLSPLAAEPQRSRLYLHFSDVTAQSREEAMEVALLLQDQGFEVVEVRSIEAELGHPIPISRPTVRYFEARLKDGAQDLQQALSMILRARGIDGAVRVQDFTHYPSRPPDALEVWLASPREERTGAR